MPPSAPGEVRWPTPWTSLWIDTPARPGEYRQRPGERDTASGRSWREGRGQAAADRPERSKRLRDFYSALGISFAEEKHGEGPVHLAARVGDVVLELYPLPAGAGPADASTRLGFAVPDLDEVLARLGAAVVSGPATTAWGRRAVARDPDGRKVEVAQAPDKPT